MKIPYSWLSEWIVPPWPAAELGARLTLAGFELESLDGDTLELAVTPNRGDAMSVRGMAREVAALAGQALPERRFSPVPAQISDTFPVRLTAADACARFAGRVIRGVDLHRESPAWLRERLQSCGVRSINPVVDVTNYVMLELGTPMHAYDLALLQQGIEVRFAAPKEPLQLLDGKEVELDPSVLVIADGAGAVGMAGVMGGAHTAVSDRTVDVFFELAYFKPDVIGGCARRYGLITDAAQRFERGVDYAAQLQAMERATALLLEIAGGKPGPTTMTESLAGLPTAPTIQLRKRQLVRLVGQDIPDARAQAILESLGMTVRPGADGWSVLPPSHRFDIGIEADLIEEVARIYGYDAVQERAGLYAQTFGSLPEAQVTGIRLLQLLADRGYQEAITYSFVDPGLQSRLFPEARPLTLSNPISADMSAMRVSLWPGLLAAAGANLRRQQTRVRLVEYGNRYLVEAGGVREVATLAGVAAGHALLEQWGEKSRPVDFFDIKSDLQALIETTGCAEEFSFQPQPLACLHPGRSARILRGGTPVGWLGELHPETVSALDLTYPAIVFELDAAVAFAGRRPSFAEISKYPSIRRDLALVVDEAVTLAALGDAVRAAAGSLMQSLLVFDIYRGPGVDSGRKSVALGLILQESSRTLTDADADRIVGAVAERLRREFNASIRDQ